MSHRLPTKNPVIEHPEKYYRLFMAVAKFCEERGLQPVKRRRMRKTSKTQKVIPASM